CGSAARRIHDGERALPLAKRWRDLRALPGRAALRRNGLPCSIASQKRVASSVFRYEDKIAKFLCLFRKWFPSRSGTLWLVSMSQFSVNEVQSLTPRKTATTYSRETILARQE